MPYVDAEARARLDGGGTPRTPGELNYAITRLVDAYLVEKGDVRYAYLNEAVGALECAKLELYRRLARARTTGDIAAFRQEVTDRFGPMPQPVVRLVEVAELRLVAEGAGVSSISREDGLLVVRFGAGLSRATAMHLLGEGGLPGVRPADMTFASNQVRIRVPASPVRAWELTQAVVAKLAVPH